MTNLTLQPGRFTITLASNGYRMFVNQATSSSITPATNKSVEEIEIANTGKLTFKSLNFGWYNTRVQTFIKFGSSVLTPTAKWVCFESSRFGLSTVIKTHRLSISQCQWTVTANQSWSSLQDNDSGLHMRGVPVENVYLMAVKEYDNYWNISPSDTIPGCHR